MFQPHTITIHCSATRPEWMAKDTLWSKRQEIRRWHVEDRKWKDIGYNWLIDRNGDETHGRPWHVTGAHVAGHNTNNIGICLIGGHGSGADDKFLDNFTVEQEKALLERIEYLKDKFPSIKNIKGHNDFANKACPGFRVDQWLASNAVGVPSRVTATESAQNGHSSAHVAPQVPTPPKNKPATKPASEATWWDLIVAVIEYFKNRKK